VRFLPRRLIPALVVLSAALALTGCGSSDTSGGSRSTVRVLVTIKNDSVTPQAKPIQVSIDQPIVLDVTSNRNGELHVHSSPEHEFEVAPGHSTYRFTLNQPGVVDVEEHMSDDLVLRITVK
jgi:hypothetical protein